MQDIEETPDIPSFFDELRNTKDKEILVYRTKGLDSVKGTLMTIGKDFIKIKSPDGYGKITQKVIFIEDITSLNIYT